jgi:hypothetical protein
MYTIARFTAAPLTPFSRMVLSTYKVAFFACCTQG